jgi:hypothetical protein
MMPGLLEAPAFLCPLIRSLREARIPEAWCARRTLLGISLNKLVLCSLHEDT